MREGREEIENNDRYIYKFASRPIYSIVIFIFRNLYWTNLVNDPKVREIGVSRNWNVLPTHQILAILSS